MLYDRRPNSFHVEFDIVSLFLEYEAKILLLRRLKDKSQGDKWGLPAGKVDRDETILDALIREVLEETGIKIGAPVPNYLQSIFVKHPEHQFIFHMYHLVLKNPTKIEVNEEEHQTYKWFRPEEALKQNLVDDLDICINKYYLSN